MAYQLSYEYESIKHDVNTLFSRFYQKQSVRFDGFCIEWKEMNFNCIFAATYRNKDSARMRVVERIFRVASEFLSEDSTFLYRVAAVYMFYAVYFKQISEVKVKIRMTPTMWKDLMDFLNILIEHRHLDVAYVIQTLRKHKAFCFTAFPKYLLFGRHEFMLGIEGMVGLRQSYEADKYVSDLLSSEFIGQVKDIQQEYKDVKDKVIRESKEDEIPYLSKVLYYSNPEFPLEFEKLLAGHEKSHEAGTALKPDSLDSSQRPILSQLQELYHGIPETNTNKPEPTIQNVLGKMKERAWKASIDTSGKNKKKLEDMSDSSDSSDQGEMIYYKRSAMLQQQRSRPLKTKIVYRSGIRYRNPVED